jgi:6-phosphofructokinase 2
MGDLAVTSGPAFHVGMSATIVTLTMNPALDMFIEVPGMEPEHKLRTSRPTWRAGGGGINVSRAIGHLRGTSVALFPSGGSTGEMIATLLQRESIATSCVRVADPTRENINVTEASTGREYRFIVPGPDLGIDEWQHCLRALKSMSPAPEYVVASGSLPPGVPVDFFARLPMQAVENRFLLNVDTSVEPIRHAAVKGTFLLKPSLRELASINGTAITSSEGIEEVARLLVERNGVEAVVVSAGAGGAILIDRHHVLRIAAPLVPIVSRIGAGDSMVAGMTVALARGDSLEDAVRYGVASGAAAVMTPGHRLCAYDDTERLFAEMRHVSSGVLAIA